MLYNKVIKDYMDDWASRSAKAECIRFKRLSQRGMMLSCTDVQINEVIAEVAEIMEFRCTDISLSDNEVKVCFYMSFAKGDMMGEVPDVLVTDIPRIAEKFRNKCAVLYTGAVFGAGFEHSAVPRPNSATVIHDVIGGMFFMACRTLKKGVYYAGFGGCSIKAKALASGGYLPVMTYEDALFMVKFQRERPDELFCFDNTYGGRLADLHKALFICLDEFDRICRANGIKYFLGGGSLLGAVRHGGMIPWDDDMDVMMLRDDYRRFLEVVGSEIDDEKFFFQSAETDSDYHSIFTKIRLNGTVFTTRFSSRFGSSHQGIFLDIFVHDKTADIKLLQKLHVFATLFARSMVFHKWEGTPMHFYGKAKLLCRLATRYIKRTDMKKLERIQERVVTFFDRFPTHSLYDGTGEHLRHGAFPARWLKKSAEMKFGDRSYPVPAGYDKYLRYSYGDYMTLIPASLRKAGHDIVRFDLGEYGR